MSINKDLSIIFNLFFSVSVLNASFFFFFLSICIDFSLEGYMFTNVRHYYVLPSLNKDSTITTTG